MWHEARRQERKIRGMLVDYRRRAERRRDFYERIKADPTQFLQLHGRHCKIHLDPAIATMADSTSTMMPWQGDANVLIDRFDVRAHLDYIPSVITTSTEPNNNTSSEERQLNYERYRIIAQNSFLGISEERFLKQLHLEEQFGYTNDIKMTLKKPPTTATTSSSGCAIGFNYDEDGSRTNTNNNTASTSLSPQQVEGDGDESAPDSDLDVDLAVNVGKMDAFQAHEMNRHGRQFGMASNDFYSYLTNDLEEAESCRLAREAEHEKALFSGRKSRRERRAHREKRLANRAAFSPPSYAAIDTQPLPHYNDDDEDDDSKSSSPDNTGKITYITSFGNDEEKPSTSATVNVSNKNKRRRHKSPKRQRYKSHYHHRQTKRQRHRCQTSTSSSCENSPITTPSMVKVHSSSTSQHNVETNPPPPRVMPRYYGRKKSDQSSGLSDFQPSDGTDDDTATKSNQNDSLSTIETASSAHGNSAILKLTKRSEMSSVSIQERLKRKRQAQLNRQFKADKIAENLKTQREKQEQQHREEELREMALKLRRRQRERRHHHQYGCSESSTTSTPSSKRSNSDSSHSDSTTDSIGMSSTSSDDSYDSRKRRQHKQRGRHHHEHDRRRHSSYYHRRDRRRRDPSRSPTRSLSPSRRQDRDIRTQSSKQRYGSKLVDY